MERRWNAARLDGYLSALAPARGPDGASSAPALPPGGAELVDETTAASEAVILALRLDRGLSIADAAAGPLAPHLAWAVDAGLLETVDADPPRVHLTTRGRLLSNELFSRLI